MADVAVQITTGGLGKFFGLTSQQMDSFAALGFKLYQQGKTNDAESVFKGMIALDSESYYGYAGLGAIALSQDSPDLNGIYENLKRAAELKPDDPTVHANLGEVLLRQARFEDAARAFETSLRLDGNQRNAGANRARAILGGIDLIAAEVQKIQAAKS